MTWIYLDHNATTPIAPDVIRAMQETSRAYWANPSSGHALGITAREELQKRRQVIARFIGADPEEIIFTAGGTESDNLALIGTAHANHHKGKHIIISAIEHHAILESCEILLQQGFDITQLPVDRSGMVDPGELDKVMRKDTILISIMHANNEVGTLQPIQAIGEIAKDKGVLFHTDAAQSIGKIPVRVDEINVDLLTCSSHKIYGPKGVGFLYVRKGTPIRPILAGGGQETGLRAGTENLPGIAGLAQALEIADERMSQEARTIAGLRDTLWEQLLRRIDGLHMNGHPKERLPGTLSIFIEGIRSTDLIAKLNQERICLSASAACATHSITPSHVLSAMGMRLKDAAGTLRISLGRSNSQEEIPQVVEAITLSVKQLRRHAS